jgi:RNA-binding protein YhbY
MATARHKAIAELMNGICTNRTFTGNEIALIEIQIHAEKDEREVAEIKVDTRTKKGKQQLCKRIADKINAEGILNTPLEGDHIHLYRRCRIDEYTERTGKCAWGFKDICQKFGYDPVTRKEIEV